MLAFCYISLLSEILKLCWMSVLWLADRFFEFSNFCLNRTYVKIRFVKTTKPFCFTQLWTHAKSFFSFLLWLIHYDSNRLSQCMTQAVWVINLAVRGEAMWCSGPKMTNLFVQTGVIKIFETFLGKFFNLHLHTVWDYISRNQNRY